MDPIFILLPARTLVSSGAEISIRDRHSSWHLSTGDLNSPFQISGDTPPPIEERLKIENRILILRERGIFGRAKRQEDLIFVDQ